MLLPSDAAGRSLELLLLLEELWHDRRLGEGRRPFRLVFVHAMAENVKSFAKSQIEWLNSSIADAFNLNERHAFQRTQAKVCVDLAEFDDYEKQKPGPRVVITTHHSLEAGVAKVLLSRWADDSKNRVIFTQRASPGTLAARLQTATVRPLTLAIDVPVRKPLDGAELEEYERDKAAKKLEREQEEERVSLSCICAALPPLSTPQHSFSTLSTLSHPFSTPHPSRFA